MRIHWKNLKLIRKNAERADLSEFWVLKELKNLIEHRRSEISYLKHGLPHEKPDDPSTWGPKWDEIDFAGLDDAMVVAKETARLKAKAIRKAKEEQKKRQLPLLVEEEKWRRSSSE